MAFREALEQLLDLPYAYAMKEVESKIIGTLLKVNGELTSIIGIAETYITISDEGKVKAVYRSKVVSLEAWLPETGVYQNDKGEVCFIYKKPIRQWKRSFSLDFYSIEYFNKTFPLKEIVNSRKATIWVDKGGIIYYFAIPIGYIEDSKQVVCTNELFEQELLDWRKNE